MTDKLPLPVDVRLMNMTALVLFLGFALLTVGALATWLLAIRCFRCTPLPSTGS